MRGSDSASRLAIGMTYAITVLCAGSSTPTPLYGEYARVYRLHPFAVTALFAIYVAAIVPTMVLCGGLSDVVGRRRALSYGLCLSAVGSLVLATATVPAQLFCGRVLQGTSLGLSSGAATAALADGLPYRRAALLASLGVSLGSAGGPLLCGLVAQVTPAPLRYPFVVHLLLLAPTVFGVVHLPKTRPRCAWRPRRPCVPREIRSTFALAACTTLLSWSLLGFFLALAPAVVNTVTRSGGTMLGGAIVALMLTSAAGAQSLSGRLTIRRTLVIGLLTMAAGTVTLMIAVIGRDMLVLTAAAVIVGVGQGLGFSAALAIIAEVAPPGQRGEVLTAVYLVGYLALAVPVLGIGLLAGHIGLLNAVIWFGAPTATGCLVLTTFTARRW